MIVTRLRKVPWSWVWLSQLPFAFWMITTVLENTAFALILRKFEANPAIIATLIAVARLPIMVLAPLVNYLSDHVWTRWGRRKPFYVLSNGFCALALVGMPMAPNIVVLTALFIVYQLAIALGKTFFPLSQEVIPIPQRGRGAAIHQIMFQAGLITYFWLIFGRLDDVYFVGPLMALGPMNGDTYVFWLGALLMLLPLLIVALGIKELPIPGMKTLADTTGGKRFSVFRFLGRLLRDICARQWLILYLLIFGVAVLSLSLGPMEAFLYTEQWGYSLQDMGSNTTIGLLILLPIIVVFGWLADRVSKMAVFLGAITVATTVFAGYYLFVRLGLAGQRPELWQILAFGTMAGGCVQLAQTMSWPLLFEYIPRKQMGTANAGFELVWALLGAMLPPIMGWWIAGYSAVFLPGAGSQLHVVLNAPVPVAVLETKLRPETEGSGSANGLDIRPFAFPGRDAAEASQVLITLEDEPGAASQGRAGFLRDERAALTKRLEGMALVEQGQGSSFLLRLFDLFRDGPKTRAEIEPRLAAIDAEIAERESELNGRVEAFRSTVASRLGSLLAAPAGDLADVQRIACEETQFPLSQRPMKPVVAAVSRALRARHPDIVGFTVEAAPDDPGAPAALSVIRVLGADPHAAPALDLRAEIAALLDHPETLRAEKTKRGFVAAMAAKLGISSDLSDAEIAPLVQRMVDTIAWDRARPRPLPALRLVLSLTNALTPAEAGRLAGALAVQGQRLVDASPVADRSVAIVATFLPGREDAPASAATLDADAPVRARLSAVADAALPLSTIERLYLDATPALRTVRSAPKAAVVDARFAPRKYDYFSAYLLLTIAGFVGCGCTLAVIRMEKIGWIQRLGVLEDQAERKGTQP